MAAQFPSICYIKGVYAAQLNIRINQRRLAGSSQDCWSTRKSTDSYVFFICCIHGVLQHKASRCLLCLAKCVKVVLACENSTRHFKWIRLSQRSISQNMSSAVCGVCTEMCPHFHFLYKYVESRSFRFYKSSRPATHS